MGLFFPTNNFFTQQLIFMQHPIFVKQHQARFNLVCDQASAETDRKTTKENTFYVISELLR